MQAGIAEMRECAGDEPDQCDTGFGGLNRAETYVTMEHLEADQTDVDRLPVIVQISPIQDLLQATQDRLYSRLFQS